jgi:hypothetical protein
VLLGETSRSLRWRLRLRFLVFELGLRGALTDPEPVYGLLCAVLRYRSYSSSGYSSPSPSAEGSAGIVSIKSRPRVPRSPGARGGAEYFDVGPRGSEAVREVPIRGRGGVALWAAGGG